MEINDYYLVLGTFRLRNTEVLDEAAVLDNSDNSRILVDTGVSYNVDHIIGKSSYIRRMDIMTKFGVDHLDNFDWYLTNHLRFLRKDRLEYALVHFYEPRWEELVKKMLEHPQIVNVGVSNFSITQLKEYFDKFGVYPKVNEIEFSRRYHDIDLINFCHDHDIQVLAYGVLGGIHDSKQWIRQYLLEDLFSFVSSNGVTPIIRTDSLLHLQEDLSALQLKTEVNGKVTDSVSYELTSETDQDRALNKFRYDRPKNALRFSYKNQEFITLDPHIPIDFDKDKVISIYHPEIPGYSIVPRDFMMITDYLVRDKFNMNECHNILVNDDCILNRTTGQFISYLMLADSDGSLIKSGSESAKVFRKGININGI